MIRLVLPIVAVLGVVTSRWHPELIYPIREGFAGRISSGFISFHGAGAVRFDHALWYLAVLLVAALAVDYLRLLMQRGRCW